MIQLHLFLGALIFSTNVFAADTTTTMVAGGSSEAMSRTSFYDHIHVGLFTNFHGPNITRMGDPYTVDNKGKTSSRGMNFDSELTTAYMFTSTIGLGPVVPFFFDPTRGQDVTIGDVGIKAFDRKTIATSNFRLYTNLILQMPTSDDSQLQGREFMIKTTPNFRYDIPDSRFAVGAWTEAKAYLGADKGKLFKLYAGPYVNYTLTPKLSLNLEFEVESNHNVGTAPLDFKTHQTDICPGVVYMITPKVIFNPYMQIFTTDKVAMDHTSIGAILTASI